MNNLLFDGRRRDFLNMDDRKNLQDEFEFFFKCCPTQT